MLDEALLAWTDARQRADGLADLRAVALRLVDGVGDLRDIENGELVRFLSEGVVANLVAPVRILHREQRLEVFPIDRPALQLVERAPTGFRGEPVRRRLFRRDEDHSVALRQELGTGTQAGALLERLDTDRGGADAAEREQIRLRDVPRRERAVQHLLTLREQEVLDRFQVAWHLPAENHRRIIRREEPRAPQPVVEILDGAIFERARARRPTLQQAHSR